MKVDSANKETMRALLQLKELKRLGGSFRLAAEGWKEEWQTLIAIIMSARTLDETTIRVGVKLFETYPTMRELAYVKETDVAAIIRPVNFYKNKTKSVIACARSIVEKFGGVVPHDREKLVTLAGVGRKTANVFLAETGKDAIGVDTHVAYVSHALAWSMQRDPDMIESDLCSLFPKSRWRDVNTICVQFGKKYRSRRQKNALLARIKSICPQPQ